MPDDEGDDDFDPQAVAARGEVDEEAAKRIERIHAMRDADLIESYARLRDSSLDLDSFRRIELEIEIKRRGLDLN